MERLNRLSINLLGGQQQQDILNVELFEDKEYGIIKLNKVNGLNSLDGVMMKRISEELLKMERNDKIKCIGMMSSVEKAFCAGADIKSIEKESYEQVINNDFMDVLRQTSLSLSKPLVMGVNGFVLGGGFELALSADILICTQDTIFQLPEINLGLVPGLGGTQRLTHIIGKQLASYYIMTADQINSHKALSLNIVSQVVPDYSQIYSQLTAILLKISAKSRVALSTAKKCIAASQDLGLTQGIQVEKYLFQSLYNTKNKHHGVSAFINKTKPNFTNI